MEWLPETEQWFELDGCRLEARCLGPSPNETPTIILLHEGLGCVSLWRDFPEKLSKVTGLGVLAYSRQGYGRSTEAKLPRPLDYMHREATEKLPQIIDIAGITECMLCGHSDGASIAAIYAGKFNDPRLRGICLIAPHFFAEKLTLNSIAKIRENYRTGDMRARLSRYHEHPDNAFWGWNSAWLDPGFENWSIEEYIVGIKVPVLTIQGLKDPYGSVRQVEVLERNIRAPFGKILLEGCGHAPHQEHMGEVLEQTRRFSEGVFHLEMSAQKTV